MEPPNAVYAQCPNCKQEALHRVLKGKLTGKKDVVLEALIRCSNCGHRHPQVIRSEKPVVIPLIISDEAQSAKEEMEFAPGEEINVGDDFHHEECRVKITAIETESRRVQKATAREIKTLWAKKFERLKLKISINKGSKTLSRTVWAVPDEEFFIGDVMRIKGLNIAIFAIKTHDKMVKYGSVEAAKIVRMYAKIVR